MSFDWTGLEGRSIADWNIESLARARDGSADYIAVKEGKAVWLELASLAAEGTAGLRQSWDLARQFPHDGLLRIHETGETELDGEGFAYALFDLPDDDLGEILAGRTLSQKEARSMIYAAAGALRHLHSRSLGHRAVTPSNLLVIGDNIKLAVDTIAPAGDEERAADLRQLGVTITRALAGSDEPGAVRRLPQPFREIALALARAPANGWTAASVIDALDGKTVRPAVDPAVAGARPPGSRGIRHLDPRALIAVAAGLTIFGIALHRFVGPGKQTPAAVETRQAAPAAGTDEKARPAAGRVAPAPAPQRHAERHRDVRPSRGSWAVVAATYRDYRAAQHRADRLRARSPHLRPQVFPPAGEGKRYFVLLGSGLTQAEAEKLRREARQAGAPRDTYITKLDVS